MSIVSGTGAVRLTEDVHSAVLAVSRRYDFDASSSDSESTPLFVPFCTLKLVDGSQSTFTIDVSSSTTPHSSADAGAVPATWESLVASLPRDQCRMAVAQVPWRAHSDSVVRTRLVFLLWAPDSTSTKERMMASMFSKGAKGLIDHLPVQASGVDDLSLEDVENKIRAKATVK
ncbi:Cofilin/tropomyosin-type actin-binding protein [Acanthamoeba castellanii str. Neff]|uniref:Cofilin/tropomyosin-type actin-binding protein n=1 Tax=Acanthamoeba castellanii (strain ATCC 30010 / Neff) TaxID=1257118 RepID=L8GSZ2_ACACF|nr:Cofilin/tropomyosin-type actin-binding protein [Acanthamoeba castellanii str. Neff]ELR16324.1 Cofilin/tropomyosin-type actin-binding protein [Acanthamoeba castellanii str. Neff]